MVGNTFVVAVMNTVDCLTVDTDGSAGMLQGTGEPVPSCILEALTTGIIVTAGMLSAYHNVTLTAVLSLVIRTIVHRTFQISHLITSFRF